MVMMKKTHSITFLFVSLMEFFNSVKILTFKKIMLKSCDVDNNNNSKNKK